MNSNGSNRPLVITKVAADAALIKLDIQAIFSHMSYLERLEKDKDFSKCRFI